MDEIFQLQGFDGATMAWAKVKEFTEKNDAIMAMDRLFFNHAGAYKSYRVLTNAFILNDGGLIAMRLRASHVEQNEA
jgi:hypothetical protein